MREREHILNDNLRILLFKFSTPAILGMLVSSLYNVVDSIFLGRGVGSIAIAALTIVLPVQILMMAIGFMIGVGSASIISRSLGEGNKEIAVNVAGNGILINLLINVLLMVPAFLFIDKILLFLGASEEVFPFTRDYLSIILWGFIFFSFSIFSNNIIRAEGRPRAAMYSVVIGAISNILLDPIFIFGFRMGVKGAALATILSQMIGAFYIVSYFVLGRSIFHLNLRMFMVRKKLVRDILAIGFPSFIMATIDSVIFLMFNKALVYYGSDLDVAVTGVAFRVIDFTLMPILGISQGFSTIVGFNYGAKLYKRVKKVLGEATLWTTLIASLGFVVMMFFPEFLLSIFSSSKEFVTRGVLPIRIMVVLLPTLGIQILGGNLFQAIGKPVPALVLTLSRQLVFLIPAIIILPIFFGLNGVWLSWPVSDFLASLITGVFVFKEISIFNRTLRVEYGEIE
ncbi:MAG: MATE family efflux transporter [Actinobacteria bacterium]|nr:MATE family efflux transporter [Actinomycetota bacterium]